VATFALLATLGVLGLAALSLVIGKLHRNSVELEQRVLARTEDLSLANAELQITSPSVRELRPSCAWPKKRPKKPIAPKAISGQHEPRTAHADERHSSATAKC
jgi:hypothetical protein